MLQQKDFRDSLTLGPCSCKQGKWLPHSYPRYSPGSWQRSRAVRAPGENREPQPLSRLFTCPACGPNPFFCPGVPLGGCLPRSWGTCLPAFSLWALVSLAIKCGENNNIPASGCYLTNMGYSNRPWLSTYTTLPI